MKQRLKMSNRFAAIDVTTQMLSKIKTTDCVNR